MSLADLIDQPWVLPPPDTVLGRFGAEIFRKRGLEPPRAVVVAPSLQLRLSLMSGGPHLTLLPRAMLHVSGTHPAIVPIPLELPETERPVGLVRLKGRSMSPVLGTFLARARGVTSRMLTDPEST